MNISLRKSVALTVAISIFAMPLLAQKLPIRTEGEGTSEATRRGEMDAERDVSSTMWMAAGCCFGLLGVGAAYLLEPTPSMSRVAGKSEEYRMAYTDAYKAAGKSKQTSAAIKGCVAAVALNACAWGLYCCLLGSLSW